MLRHTINKVCMQRHRGYLQTKVHVAEAEEASHNQPAAKQCSDGQLTICIVSMREDTLHKPVWKGAGTRNV